MLSISLLICAFVSATFTLGQHLNYRKPWPRYSLQNMPQTQFTCHDKILGGYYADAETQCQMFHVCVKVAGVGVQDFRFLCPNGTAFDQEAQICADWGDVDCEQSVLYYGSDNFDLYRIGSGFESKRAPLAEEEEATFHLQRAETGDVRRSKETRIDQKLRPDQPPNYTKYFDSTPRSLLNNYASVKQHPQKQQQQQQQQYQQKQLEVIKKPTIANYYTPTSTTTTTTERYSNDVSKQDFDEIFKGSHSSHFFSNRNGGREDDLELIPKPQLNEFNEYNKKTESSTNGKTRAPQPTRSKRIQKPTTTTTATPTTVTTTARVIKTTKATTTSTTTAAAPKVTKKIALPASYNADYTNYAQNYRSSTTIKTTTTTTTPSPTITTARAIVSHNNNNRNSNSNSNRFNLGASNYQTQAKIQPTTYSPAYGVYNLKVTTPKYADLFNDKINQNNQVAPLLLANGDVPRSDKTQQYNNKPTAALSQRKSQKLERTKSTKLAVKNSTYVNLNELPEFSKIKVAQPKPFQPSQVFRAPIASPNVEPQYYRTRGQQQVQHVKFGNEEPAPFSVPQKEGKAKSTTNHPRVAGNRGSINYKASTQREAELFGPTTYSSKKFSTLVPKDLYSPTTFKPTTHYNKPSYELFHQPQQTVRPAVKTQKIQSNTPTTTLPTTTNPYYNADEDDGQYHPELYETDFPRNRLNLQRSSTTTTTSSITTTSAATKKPFNYNFQSPQTHLKTQQQTFIQKQQEQSSQSVDLSDEDELFKTAHSLNFGAASINKLRADIIKAEKTSQQYNSQYSPSLQVTSPKPATATAATYSTTPTHSYSTTIKPQFTTYPTTSTPYTTTTVRTTQTTTTKTTPKPIIYDVPKSNNKTSGKASKSSGKGKKHGAKSVTKSSSNRPPHADEDTSYDYAYYDTDTLSESPQEYPEYEISEFIKTRKN